MSMKEDIPISGFEPGQTDILFKTLVLQKLFPGKFLIKDPWPYDEIDEKDVGRAKDTLRELMSLDTMVTDMWDWDIHFEDTTFEDSYFDIALGREDYALSEAENLKEDILGWIDEYGMDYAQEQYSDGQFEEWILEQCREFIIKWRLNILKQFA